MIRSVPRGCELRTQFDPIDFDPKARELGPVKINPERPSMLEAEVEAIIISAINSGHVDTAKLARRILKVDRIRTALFGLDQHDTIVQRSFDARQLVETAKLFDKVAHRDISTDG